MQYVRLTRACAIRKNLLQQTPNGIRWIFQH